jgi:hypothetical protein
MILKKNDIYTVFSGLNISRFVGRNRGSVEAASRRHKCTISELRKVDSAHTHAESCILKLKRAVDAGWEAWTATVKDLIIRVRERMFEKESLHI